MPWVKLDDRFDDNRKLKRAWRLDDGSVGLYVMALTYVSRNELDGQVDAIWLEERVPDEERRVALCAALVAACLFEPGESEGEFVIHDYLDHNTSRAERAAKRESERHKKAEQRTQISVQQDTTHAGAPARAGLARLGEPEESDKGEDQIDARVVRGLFAYWQQKCNHPNARLSGERRGKLVARLREGRTEDEVRQAIDGAAKAAHVSDNGQRFDDIELVCRSAVKFESFLARATATPGVAARDAAVLREVVA